MEKRSTGYVDCNGREILEGDLLLNPMIGDKWRVVESDGTWEAWLIPSSGFLGAPDDAEYPYHREELEYIGEVFEVIDDNDNVYAEFANREIEEAMKIIEMLNKMRE